MKRDINDRAREGTLPSDPAAETVRMTRPRPRAVEQVEASGPTAIEAERAICGSILWAATYQPDTSWATLISDAIRTDMFAHAPNAALFDALVSLEREGAKPDAVSVQARTTRDGRRVDSGYVDQLVGVAIAPTETKLRQWAELVRDAWVRRETIARLEKAIASASDVGTRGQDIVEGARASMEALLNETTVDANVVTARAAVTASAKRITRPDRSHLPTGLRGLDQKIIGLLPRQVSVLGARTSVGKSALAASWAYHITRNHRDVGVLYASLEMSADQFVQRFAASLAGVSVSDIRRGELPDAHVGRLMAALHEIALLDNLSFIDCPGQTVGSIGALALRYKAQLAASGKRLGLIVIDHVGLVRPDKDAAKLPRREQIGIVTRWAISAAKTLGTHVLLIAQINRDSDKAGADSRPQLHNLKESGSLEEDAANVFLLHRKRLRDGTFAEEDALLIVAKHRDGETGTIRLKCEPHYMRFSDAGDD